jgi:hypothetical protein
MNEFFYACGKPPGTSDLEGILLARILHFRLCRESIPLRVRRQKMTTLNLAQTRKLPISHVTRNKRLRCQALKEYYESKIECLIDMNLPARLIMLACWDSPVGREDLTSQRARRRFLIKIRVCKNSTDN